MSFFYQINEAKWDQASVWPLAFSKDGAQFDEKDGDDNYDGDDTDSDKADGDMLIHLTWIATTMAVTVQMII